MLLIAKINQSIQTGHGLYDYVATTSTIAAIRAAKFDVFLPAK
jgi:hypothetical protein